MSRLNRATLGADAPPIRIVHLGLGAFFRAHQAWYTDAVDTAHEWGIAAFTGRSAHVAELLAPQDGLYTLIERADDADTAIIVRSVVETIDGAQIGRFLELVAAPATAVVTLTVTEPGYRLNAAGHLDWEDSEIERDRNVLRERLSDPDLRLADLRLATAPARLLLGLEARRRASAGAIAVVSCDNMPSNGTRLRGSLLELAENVHPPTVEWIESSVSFVSTSVDRITPHATEADRCSAEDLTGWEDFSPVVTEPFTDWVLSGTFPAGRPAWELAGARFVDDVEPFEQRKLLLLNGAHSLLAYAGLARGHETVAQAISDPTCRAWVEEWWDEAVRQFPTDGLGLPDYRAALLARFSNHRIEHRLEQIAAEATAKLRIRLSPVLLAERAAGRRATGAIRAIGSWVALILAGRVLADARSDAVARTARLAEPLRISALLDLIDESLAGDADIVEELTGVVQQTIAALESATLESATLESATPENVTPENVTPENVTLESATETP